MPKILLTERDIRLLTILSQCGVIKTEQTKLAYGNVVASHLKRIQKLVAAEVLVRDHGYLRPTLTGLRQAGIQIKPMQLKRHRYEEHALAVELVSQLPEYTPVYARELKKKSILRNQSRACLTIQKDKTRYAVYILDDNPKTITVNHLLTELDDLPVTDSKKTEKIDMALVFCTNDAIMQTMSNALQKKLPTRLKSCCLLPFPQGIAYFKRLSSLEFKKFIAARFPGHISCNCDFAHLTYRDAYITMLIHNDLTKLAALKSYIKYVQKKSGRRCIVVCRPDQGINIPEAEIVYDTWQPGALPQKFT